MSHHLSSKTWFITGASSGLGLQMSLAALRAGHRVIGTSRNIAQAATNSPEFQRLGGTWLQLDISEPDATVKIQDLVSQEEKRQASNQGSIHWVVVNNAGSTLLGVVEDMSNDQIVKYLDSDVMGIIRVWKAMVPVLRRQGIGTLITISSIFGFVSKAENMMYSAVKATQESLTESYADLLAPFGINTLIIQPGGFRTSFPANNTKADGPISKDYKERVQTWMDYVDEAGRHPDMVNGDPSKFGQVVVDAVDKGGEFAKLWAAEAPGKVLRAQLGSDSYQAFGSRLKDLNNTFSRMSDIARITDIDA